MPGEIPRDARHFGEAGPRCGGKRHTLPAGRGDRFGNGVADGAGLPRVEVLSRRGCRWRGLPEISLRPLADLRFCPTGGVSPANAATYLALGNVLCVGGSWMVPKAKVQAGDWAGITALARDAAQLGR